jgi:bifunctional DNase/RNase
MIELKVEAVAVDYKGNPVVVLREKKGRRKVFIWIGLAEAQAISLHLDGQQPPRPLTHDLMAMILGELGATVRCITISDMESNTYYAELQIESGDRGASIDCRPSDAIAIALRAEAPVYIDDELLDRLDAMQKESREGDESTVVDSGETTVH